MDQEPPQRVQETRVAAQPSDAELVSRANAGDAGAFEAIYLRYRDWIVRLARRFTGGDRELALDVMQETFMHLLRRFPGFVLTAQFKTYLYPVRAEVPAARDDAMRTAIRAHFDRAATQHRSHRWRMAPVIWACTAAASIAAVVAVAAWLGVFALPSTNPPSPKSTALANRQPADVDANGRIDILDAFALARQLEAKQSADRALDVTFDGAIDQRDVDAIAVRAVALRPRPAPPAQGGQSS